MNQLSSEARRLFQLARSLDEPQADTLRRVESSLAARLAGATAGAAVTAATTKAVATVGTVVPWLKIVALAGVTTALVGAGWWSSSLHWHAAQRGVVSVSHPATSPAPLLVSPAMAMEPANEPNPAVPIPAEPVSSVRSAAKLRAPLAASNPSTADPVDPLHAEIRDLREAQQALRRGEGASVLSLLDQQDKNYAGGSLQEERTAARVLALCQMGRRESARAVAQRFEQQWPKSSLLARLKNSCWKQ